MKKYIMTMYCMKDIDGVLLAKEIALQIQKSGKAKFIEMITILENKNYDCFYIFITAEESLKFNEIFNYFKLKNILIRLGFVDKIHCGDLEEGSFINISEVLIHSLGLVCIEFSYDLPRGYFYKLCDKPSFDTSLDIEGMKL